MSPVRRFTDQISEVESKGVPIMRAYRNGRLVFRHVQPYNPSGAFSLRFQSNDALVRLMNPVEEVDIS